jgi:hypothetical protein
MVRQRIRIGTVGGPIESYQFSFPLTWNTIIERVAERLDLSRDCITLVYGGRGFRFLPKDPLKASFGESDPRVFLVVPRVQKKTEPAKGGIKDPPVDDDDDSSPPRKKSKWTTETDNSGREIVVID